MTPESLASRPPRTTARLRRDQRGRRAVGRRGRRADRPRPVLLRSRRRAGHGGGERAAAVPVPGCADLPAARGRVRAGRDSGPVAGVPQLRGRAPAPPGPRDDGRTGRPGPARSSRSPTSSATPATAGGTSRRSRGYRTLISAPLILDDEVVGAISLWRTKVEPFDERATAMLEAFAAQAAAVVRNVHLVRALEARQARAGPQGRAAAGAERGRRDGQLDAWCSTTCCSRSSSTPCGSPSATAGRSWSTSRPTGASWPGRPIRAARSCCPDCARSRSRLDETLVGRAAREGRPIGISDIAQVERDVHLQLLYEDGWRSVLAVPVLRDGQIIGVMVVRRKTTGRLLRRDLGVHGDVRQPVGARRVQRPPLPRARAQERRAGGGEPAQVGLPRQHVARAAEPR